MQLQRGEGAHSLPEASGSPPIAFPLPSQASFSAKRVLLVGTGNLLSHTLDDCCELGSRTCIAGVVDHDFRPQFCHPDVPVFRGAIDIEAVVAEQCIDEIRVVLPDRRVAEQLPGLEATARALGVSMTFYYPTPRPSPLGAAAQRGRLVVHSPVHASNRGWRWAVKRGIDVLISGAALLLLAPLFLLIVIAIKLTSPGPVLFHQQRIGLGRRQFRMLKFRTMLKNAEELRARIREKNNARGISFKVFEDPRVTKVGALLRRTSLDELPQLINVLLGDMTLVGPRPIPVWVAEQMQGSAYLRRFSVKQGITGLWQVEGRQQDFDHMATQDLCYVDRWSLALDLSILLRTLPAVIRGEGAH